MQEHILVVDDDNDVLELLEYTLRSAGYDVLGFLNTKHVREVLAQERIDLILMDRSLPDIEGSLYVEMLRSKNINIPVIFLSGKDSQEEIKSAFLKGADDYMTKPFDVEELLLRVKAVLRRSNSQTKEVVQNLEYKDIALDLNLQKVRIQDQDVSLTKLEAALLKLLIQNRGRVLDREYLLKKVWKNSQNIHQKTVNVAIKRLKEKIDPSNNKEYIKTIRGVGYMMA
ncbi:response regulator transcription factor [Sulfurimonas sp.]|uniref:response regulator transcription factor n=1 Tax=Sulfurimonas sp. TaxID=2022749 RepID=UPI0026362FAF|nr:response regulator transcription factor [Sulfurimonas sp.]